MGRTYAIPTLLDDDGLPIVNAWCRAIRLDTQALVEPVQYTDKNGDATFTTLPDAVDCTIHCTWVNELGKEQARRFLSEAHPTMDEVRDGGEYGKIYQIDISDHSVKLSATVESASANYVTNNEKTGAKDGYDFFETKLTAYGLSIKSSAGSTRIELTASHIAGYKAGVLQFEIKASDGKAYFGAGTIVADATGLTFNDAPGKAITLKANGLNDAKIELVSPGGGLRLYCPDGIYLTGNIKDTSVVPATDKGCSLGESSTPKRFNYGHFYRLGDGTKPIERIYVNEIRGYGTSYCGHESYPFNKVVGDQLVITEVGNPGSIAGCGQLYTDGSNLLGFIDGDGGYHTIAFT